MNSPEEQKLQEALDLIHNDPNYRISTRLTLPDNQPVDEHINTRHGVFISIDTNGLDAEVNKIIRIALQQFTYVLETSTIIETKPLIVELNAPDAAIPPHITRINGVTPEMVEGHQFNLKHLTEVLTNADLIVSHQAYFARPFLERTIPETTSKAWACLIHDIPWGDYGLRGKPSMPLLLNHFDFFLGEDLTHPSFIGKPADAVSGVAVLAQPITPEGMTVLGALRQAAGATTYRIYVNSQNANTLLKPRGYTWNSTPPSPQAWKVDLKEDQLQAEIDWLNEFIYNSEVTHNIIEINAFTRYSQAAAN